MPRNLRRASVETSRRGRHEELRCASKRGKAGARGGQRGWMVTKRKRRSALRVRFQVGRLSRVDWEVSDQRCQHCETVQGKLSALRMQRNLELFWAPIPRVTKVVAGSLPVVLHSNLVVICLLCVAANQNVQLSAITICGPLVLWSIRNQF